MERDMMTLQMAVTAMRDLIPMDKSLTKRLLFAMRYVREHGSDLFWMVGHASEETKLRTALAAVMLTGNDEDKDVLARSMKPLQMLNAAMQGIPVDFGAMPADDDLLPLMALWHESESKSGETEKEIK